MSNLAKVKDFKVMMANHYAKELTNFFRNDSEKLKFLSNVSASIQKNPKLLECTPESLMNAFITMAQLNLMPSNISGEAYVIPYKKNYKEGNIWKEKQEAQFQLGYQGYITFFYRTGAVKDIFTDVIRKKDRFSYINGKVEHEIDIFADDRGEEIGAYVVVRLNTGGQISKVMKKEDIINHGQKFSKSFAKDDSPWKEGNDPERWMWKKTIIKQLAKIMPKNELFILGISEDNKDSNIGEPVTEKIEPSVAEALKIKHVTITNEYDETQENNENQEGGAQKVIKQFAENNIQR